MIVRIKNLCFKNNKIFNFKVLIITMVRIKKEFILSVLNDLDKIHRMRFRAPKSSVDWGKARENMIWAFESFLYVEQNKRSIDSLQESFPDHSDKIVDEGEVELDSDELKIILDTLSDIIIEKGLHKTRVVDGDDVHKIIEVIEDKTGVEKENYNYYPEKESM